MHTDCNSIEIYKSHRVVPKRDLKAIHFNFKQLSKWIIFKILNYNHWKKVLAKVNWYITDKIDNWPMWWTWMNFNFLLKSYPFSVSLKFSLIYDCDIFAAKKWPVCLSLILKTSPNQPHPICSLFSKLHKLVNISHKVSQTFSKK